MLVASHFEGPFIPRLTEPTRSILKLQEKYGRGPWT